MFRGGDDLYIQSRDLRPLDRYFPGAARRVARALPTDCVLDGEIVIATRTVSISTRCRCGSIRRRRASRSSRARRPRLRRVRRARASDGRDLASRPQSERRALLERAARATAAPPLHLTPMTRDATRARLARSGSRAPGSTASSPSRRPALPARQARDDQGQARAHRRLRRRRVPLAQEASTTRSARCCSASTTTRRAASRRRHVVVHDGDAQASSCEELRRCARARSTTTRGATGPRRARSRRACPAAQSRWSARQGPVVGAVRIERVCEVKYDHLQGDRFRHAATSCAGAPTSRRASAGTISSRSRRLTSSRSSARRRRLFERRLARRITDPAASRRLQLRYASSLTPRTVDVGCRCTRGGLAPALPSTR